MISISSHDIVFEGCNKRNLIIITIAPLLFSIIVTLLGVALLAFFSNSFPEMIIGLSVTTLGVVYVATCYHDVNDLLSTLKRG